MESDKRTDRRIVAAFHSLDKSLKSAGATARDLNRQMLRTKRLGLPQSQAAARVYVHLIAPDGFVFGMAGLDFTKDTDRCDFCGQPGGGDLTHRPNKLDPGAPLVVCTPCWREGFH